MTIVIGPRTQAEILHRISRPTCVISRICAYAKNGLNGELEVIIHIMSDDGEKNTIVKRLYELAAERVGVLFYNENLSRASSLKWKLTIEEQLLEGSQLLFKRAGPQKES